MKALGLDKPVALRGGDVGSVLLSPAAAVALPAPVASTTPAGWYDDLARAGHKRWWDGTAWGIRDDEHSSMVSGSAGTDTPNVVHPPRSPSRPPRSPSRPPRSPSNRPRSPWHRPGSLSHPPSRRLRPGRNRLSPRLRLSRAPPRRPPPRALPHLSQCLHRRRLASARTAARNAGRAVASAPVAATLD